jgi:hypothetical protein
MTFGQPLIRFAKPIDEPPAAGLTRFLAGTKWQPSRKNDPALARPAIIGDPNDA